MEEPESCTIEYASVAVIDDVTHFVVIVMVRDPDVPMVYFRKRKAPSLRLRTDWVRTKLGSVPEMTPVVEVAVFAAILFSSVLFCV